MSQYDSSPDGIKYKFRYGFRWPDSLSCDSLPRMSDQMTSGNICAAPPDTPKDHKVKVGDIAYFHLGLF